MKRSEINATIKKMEALMEECRFKLPPYFSFTPDEWAEKNHESDEIRECELGWDVTDYGEGKFDTLGLALITIRNGNVHNPKYNKPYAEKIMMCDSGQVSPMHYHANKLEDIINRGGNDIVFTFYNADKTKVHRTEDGRKYIGFGTFFNAILQGYVVTFFYYLVCKLGAPEVLWQKLVTVVIGLLVGGIGLAMYQNAKAGASPYDSLSMILCDRSHKSYFGCRMLTDLICAVICFASGGIVNVGTVASVLLMGPVADIINRKFVSRIIKDDAEVHGRYRPNYWTV